MVYSVGLISSFFASYFYISRNVDIQMTAFLVALIS